MYIFGSVGAVSTRVPLENAIKGWAKSDAIEGREVGESWIISSNAQTDGSFWQVGDSDGPHVRIEADDRGVTVTTDSLAYWPFYYAKLDGGVVFGTALEPILRSLKPPLDFMGCCQKAMLGTTIGSKTRFVNVSRMRLASRIQLEPGTVESEQREFWTTAEPGGGPALLDRLRGNIKRRAGSAQSVTALLSGGLDSRVVVALLREAGYSVDALNFAQPGNQDETYARQFAAAAGVTYHSRPRLTGELGQLNIAARGIADAGIESDMPGVVWTGMIASVVLGGVYYNETIIDALRAGDYRTAAEQHCADEKHSLPRRLFSHGEAARLENGVITQMADEMKQYQTPDPAHSFTLYYVANIARAGGDLAYNGIKDHGLDQYSPFVEEQAIRIILGIDPTRLLRHEFYHEWLELLPDTVMAAPWQTYPGHLPCPVPRKEDLHTQWQQSKAFARGIRRQSRRAAAEVLRGGPSELSKSAIALALVLDTLGIRDCDTMLAAASAFRPV